jgi:Heterokaryon incompatibility protein (HET)
VQKKDIPTMSGLYVTLSHCWGKQKPKIILYKNTLSDFQKGIVIHKLARTFQDAIKFAIRLDDRIRYIWIDSLCIIQDDTTDWREESAKMHEVYKYSYCNISATAATDGSKGLFFDRTSRQLWENEVSLNTIGIPAKLQGKRLVYARSEAEDVIVNSGDSYYDPNDRVDPKDNIDLNVQLCTVLDTSFWGKTVDDAPVNRRGWVLQERLMAPRVLHFCKDQIAWECQELDAAEYCPDGLPSFQLREGNLVDGGRLKGLVPHKDGLRLYRSRTTKLSDSEWSISESSANSKAYSYELWKRLVEVYSRTRITNSGDKLIAFSGIAKMMFEKTKDIYVAGMWRNYLESQLLWRVDPVFENGRFSYLSKRAPTYRAPSFSWASIDADRGITYGESTDAGLLIQVIEASDVSSDGVQITYVTNNKFGEIKGGHVDLTGILRKIEMKEFQEDDSVRYGFVLVNDGKATTEPTFRNVYLDSPSSDTDIFGPNGHIYCLPSRIDFSKYLVCLLLKFDEVKGQFKRIGLARIHPYSKHQRILHPPNLKEAAKVLPSHWDGEKHTIEII